MCLYIVRSLSQNGLDHVNLAEHPSLHTHLPLPPLLLSSPISIFTPLIRWFGPITVKERWERARPFVNQTHPDALYQWISDTHINFFKKHHIKSCRFTENSNLRATAEATKILISKLLIKQLNFDALVELLKWKQSKH